MTDSPGGVPPTITLDLGGHRVALDVDVPDSPATARVALPLARAAADAATAHAGPVSCGPGCAACCRELVPVAEPEAFALAAVVEAMPEPPALRSRSARRRPEHRTTHHKGPVAAAAEPRPRTAR